MCKVLAHGLVGIGIASYRLDWIGEALARGSGSSGVERFHEVAEAGAVLGQGISRVRGRLRWLGYSPCSYDLFRVALEVGQPEPAVLRSALYRSITDLFRYNYGLVLDYMRLEEQTEWAKEHSPRFSGNARMMYAHRV